MSFIGKIQQFVANISPYWMAGANNGTLLQAAALVADTGVETAGQGLRQNQPLRADPSSLQTISRDREIRLYANEPEDSKRMRLADWLQLHRSAGSHIGEMRNLKPAFSPAQPLMRIVHQDGLGQRATWWSLLPDDSIRLQKIEPSNWDFDGVPAKWSRYWAIIYWEELMPWLAPAEYGDGTVYGDGTLWGGGPSLAQQADIVAAIKEFDAAHSQLWGVIITNDPLSFEPGSTATTDPDGWTSLPVGNWGAAVDPITGLPNRPPYASFIFDEGQG